MITKQKIVLISIIAVTSLLLLTMWAAKSVAKFSRSEAIYKQGLVSYSSGDFSNAYYLFSKVSDFSVLKPAALYRQGRCADISADEKSAIKSYRTLLRKFSNSELSQRAIYLNAITYFGKNERYSEKLFRKIIKDYPQSDYAIASGYYIGVTELQRSQNAGKKRKEQLVSSAREHFRTYLREAPSGRLSTEAISQLEGISKLTDEDILLAAKSEVSLGKFQQAKAHLEKLPLEKSWALLVQCENELKNYQKVLDYTKVGLSGNSALPDDEDIIKALDCYLSRFSNKQGAVNSLLKPTKFRGEDYLMYLNCSMMSSAAKDACFASLYVKYPLGQFSAEALSNVFYSKIKQRDYNTAKAIGRKHLSLFMTSNSAPRVMFWLGKISERTKNYEDATGYYKGVVAKFPDDYYAFKAFSRLNKVYDGLYKTSFNPQPIVFPYKNQSELVKALIKVKDFSLISELYKDDDFVRSWLAYQEGDYSLSAVVARDAMDKLKQKPDKDDLRWRLVYPVHYLNEIRKNAAPLRNNEIMIEALIREESYFNPKAQSPTGAKGLMQLMGTTANEVGIASGLSFADSSYLFDEQMNIRLGNLYYANLREAFLGKDVFAVMAYNGGMGALSKWQQYLTFNDLDEFVEQIPYEETKNYVRKVLKSYWNYSRIY